MTCGHYTFSGSRPFRQLCTRRSVRLLDLMKSLRWSAELEPLKDYLAAVNGQNGLCVEHGLHEMHRFLSAQDIASMMDLMDSLFGDEGALEHISENKVQPVIWDKLWVPFAEFDGGPRLVLDLHPGNRAAGQILLWFPGVDLEADDLVIAGDFAAFSAALLQDITA